MFLDELTTAQEQNPNFTLVSTMTAMDKSNEQWRGESGYISSKMIAKSVLDLSLPIFYISGPRGMVEAMRKLLEDAGVRDDKIRTEEFSGY